MNHTIIEHDQSEEDILNYDVSDDALEAAGGSEKEKRRPTHFLLQLSAYRLGNSGRQRI